MRGHGHDQSSDAHVPYRSRTKDMDSHLGIMSSTERKTYEVHAVGAGSTDADRKDKANGNNTIQAFGFGHVIMLLAYRTFRFSAASL